jgi:hypothetical protein
MKEQPKNAPFEPGREKTGGRKKGSRNKLSTDFVAELATAFELRGKEAIDIVITESPKDFLKVIAAILPKEFEINDNRLKEIPDEQLDAFIEFAKSELAKRHLSLAVKSDSGEVAALN